MTPSFNKDEFQLLRESSRTEPKGVEVKEFTFSVIKQGSFTLDLVLSQPPETGGRQPPRPPAKVVRYTIVVR